MDLATLTTICSGIAGVLGFLYLLFVGQKTVGEWLKERSSRRVVDRQNVIEKQRAERQEDVDQDKLLEAHRLLGGYLTGLDDGDSLAIPSIIELSKHPDSRVRLICCTKGFSALRKYDQDIMNRLREIENDDPERTVRQAARKARARLALLRSDADT